VVDNLIVQINDNSITNLTEFISMDRMQSCNPQIQQSTISHFIAALKNRLISCSSNTADSFTFKMIQIDLEIEQLKFPCNFPEDEYGCCVLVYGIRNVYNSKLFESVLLFLKEKLFNDSIKQIHVKMKFLRVFTQVLKWLENPLQVRVLLFDVLALETNDNELKLALEIVRLYPEILPVDSKDVLSETIRAIISIHSENADIMLLRPLFNSIITKIFSQENERFLNSMSKSLQLISARLDPQEATTQLINMSIMLNEPQPLNIFQQIVFIIGYLSRNASDQVQIAINYLRPILENMSKEGDINQQISVCSSLVMMAKSNDHLLAISEWKLGVDECIILPDSISALKM
jgi:hypothetical protein